MGWFIFLSLDYFWTYITWRTPPLSRSTTNLKQKWPQSLQWYPSCQRPKKSYFQWFLLFLKNKSVTMKPVRFREERCYFTSALPRSDALTRPQLLSIMAPVQPPWRQNLFRRTTAFIWNLTQESVGITEQQKCTSAKEIWRFFRLENLLCCHSSQLDSCCDSHYGTCTDWSNTGHLTTGIMMVGRKYIHIQAEKKESF